MLPLLRDVGKLIAGIPLDEPADRDVRSLTAETVAQPSGTPQLLKDIGCLVIGKPLEEPRSQQVQVQAVKPIVLTATVQPQAISSVQPTNNPGSQFDLVKHYRETLQIKGDRRFQRQVNEAIDFLKRRAPHWHDFVLTHTRLIVQSSIANTAFWTEGRTTLKDSSDPIHAASVLIHEAQHLKDKNQGGGYEGEKRAYEAQIQFYEDIGDRRTANSRRRNLEQSIRWSLNFWTPGDLKKYEAEMRIHEQN